MEVLQAEKNLLLDRQTRGVISLQTMHASLRTRELAMNGVIHSSVIAR